MPAAATIVTGPSASGSSLRTLVVLAPEDADERVRVTVAHAVLRLEPLHMLHVGEVGDGGELRHPVVDGFAVLLRDRREVRLRPRHLLGHRLMLSPSRPRRGSVRAEDTRFVCFRANVPADGTGEAESVERHAR